MTDTTAFTMTGREFLQAIADGELPPAPIAETLGFALTRVGDGEVWFAGTPERVGLQPDRRRARRPRLHAAGLRLRLRRALDAACGHRLHVGRDQGQLPAPREGGRRADRARLGDEAGRRVAFAEGDVRDGQDRLVATASSTLLIMAA